MIPRLVVLLLCRPLTSHLSVNIPVHTHSVLATQTFCRDGGWIWLLLLSQFSRYCSRFCMDDVAVYVRATRRDSTQNSRDCERHSGVGQVVLCKTKQIIWANAPPFIFIRRRRRINLKWSLSRLSACLLFGKTAPSPVHISEEILSAAASSYSLLVSCLFSSLYTRCYLPIYDCLPKQASCLLLIERLPESTLLLY